MTITVEEASSQFLALLDRLTEDEPMTLTRQGKPVARLVKIESENSPATTLLNSWLAAAPTDPEEIREAEADRNEFLQNLNRNRIESGERPLFP
jgi:antitoxin (DNA-binding transcriptional repressor) of toxin-antitoxin stability system